MTANDLLAAHWQAADTARRARAREKRLQQAYWAAQEKTKQAEREARESWETWYIESVRDLWKGKSLKTIEGLARRAMDAEREINAQIRRQGRLRTTQEDYAEQAVRRRTVHAWLEIESRHPDHPDNRPKPPPPPDDGSVNMDAIREAKADMDCGDGPFSPAAQRLRAAMRRRDG